MGNPAVSMAPALAKSELLANSKKDLIRRAQALSCTLPEKNKPSCSTTVFLGMFFDGTGNNRDDDLPQNKQSNVVRLWMAHRDSEDKKSATPSAFFRSEYVPGVGTPFPLVGETQHEGAKATAGKAAAYGGQARIFWGLLQTLNALHRAVKNGPLVPDNDAGKLAAGWSSNPWSVETGRAGIKAKAKELAAILKSDPKPKVQQFTVSVFGFSRGAAQARAFCNAFYELLCEPAGAGHTLAGVPVRIIFLGIFDTVASVGVIGADLLTMEGHQAWANKALRIHPSIQRCVHYVASHEVRACFSLDSVRYKGVLPSNCVEVAYPGAHSDVGGGYRPNTQGRSSSPGVDSYNFLALVPCVHMYKEAFAAGVPLKPFDAMTAREKRNFTPSDQLLDDFNAYVGACKVSGSTEEVLNRCMDRYRFYRFRRLDSFVSTAKTQGAPADDAKFLELTNGHFQSQCKDFQRKYANAKRVADHDREFAYYQWVKNGRQGTFTNTTPSMRDNLNKGFIKEDLDMWEAMHRVGETPPALVTLFDKYVHDSMAGFAQDGVDEFTINHRGHMRNRTVYDKGGE
ncbi:T6SS phospholipase effector Tle1-like catalytic domain-containing protein [Ralstonia sp. 24A2]|uniref:T6SS phospholipase effector Tle1-like catalytic domain-containing protein n=1 Tax=Ralstonia sp. 24A2 TaxID=3447364 RepID=UPI003F695FEF